MKPFNLEKALAGEPVVTRDGRPVKIAAIDKVFVPHYVLIGWVNNMACTWYEAGVHSTNKDFDLFMAEKQKVKKEGWVIMYKDEDGFGYTTSVIFQEKPYSTRHDILAKIEWEEED